MPLINWEIELILNWSKNCIVLSNARRDATAATELRAANVSNVKLTVNVSALSAAFQITDAKLFVPVHNLSNENDKKLSEQLRTGFKRILNGINIGQKLLIRLKIT